ncbi:MAG: VPDSG-CTERM sorting domain-containing protein [Opitutaceae bacterium]|nr:VPDSG-CTERM sorting domain-containing protein [Opitutaceae bacterium]
MNPILLGATGSFAPDTASTLAMLGGVFLGLAALRRRFVS